MDPEFVLRASKAVVEVAGFSYLGQGLVGILAGPGRDRNAVYQVFRIVAGPVTRTTRLVTPRFVPDRHIPFVGFGLLLWAWILLIVGLAYVKRVA